MMNFANPRTRHLLLAPAALLAAACSPSSGTSSLSFSEFVRIEGESAASATSSSTVPSDDCDRDCSRLRQEFRYLVYVGKKIYAYWPEKIQDTKTDFDALAREIETSITTSTTPTQHYILLRRWASAFHDGHVNVMARGDLSEFEIYSAPLRLEVLAPATDHEKVIVSRVDDGTLGIKPGDEVESLNGRPVTEALDEGVKAVSGSTARMRRFSAARRLTDVMGIEAGSQPLRLDLRRDGKSFSVAVPRQAQLNVRPEGQGSPESAKETTGVELLKASVLPGGLGYLRIDGFWGSQDRFLLDQAMQRLSQTSGLLLDVRQNGGGDQSGNVILGWLARSAIVRYRTSAVMDNYVLASRPDYFSLGWTPGSLFSDWIDLRVEAGRRNYDKPVIALTSPYCFSACDTFTSALKTHKLALIAGEATGGGTGTPLVFELPVSEHRFRYSVVRGITAAGDPIEGVGTSPDVVIEPTQQERASRTDAQLLGALKLLQERVERAGHAKPGAGPAPAVMAEAAAALVRTESPSKRKMSPTQVDDLELKLIAEIDER